MVSLGEDGSNCKKQLRGRSSWRGRQDAMGWTETGKESQWITESVEKERVKTGLKFEGMDGESTAEFILAPEGNGAKVTWTYDGDNAGFMGKAIWLAMGGMLGTQYQDGLNDLKKLVESQPVQEPSTTTPADSTANQ